MALRLLARLLLRQLVLRKGLAVSAALLLVVGSIFLYSSTRHTETKPAQPRTVELLNSTPPPAQHGRQDNPLVLTDTHPLDKLPPDLSRHSQLNGHLPHLSPSHLTPSKPALPLNHTMCTFSANGKGSKVDVKMADVFDVLPYDNPDGGVWKQGFDITYSMTDFEEEPLNVYIIPHSHNDPGWIKTFEEYYLRQTSPILNLMVDALSKDERRKFIWAEVSYLDRWWKDCDDERKKQFKRLVANGQLEVVTGGWVMNDEANTHYFAMIDQMIEGHQWLREHVPGVIPQSGWAIDPFGHTPIMAYILQRMGLEGMLIQRVHYSVKKQLAQQKQLEFGWRQLWDDKGSTDILTHMMPFYSYDIPHTCGPDPSVCCQFDFKRLPGSKVKCPWRKTPQPITAANVVEQARLLGDQYRKKSRLFLTNTLLVPLGDDFRWDSLKEVEDQFSNYELLIEHFNSHPEMRINAQFGTLENYFNALRSSHWVQDTRGQGSTPFPSLTGDFFTYSDRSDHYWSGYYTTRPFYKHMDRILESKLRLAEVLFSLTSARGLSHPPILPDLLTSARRNLGLFQHHDGITGTAKDHVVIDYGQRMKESIDNVQKVIQHSSQALLLGNKMVAEELYFTLEETYPTQDSLPTHVVVRVAGKGAHTVLLATPLTTPTTRTIRITVDTPSVMVTDWQNVTVPCQVGPVWDEGGGIRPDQVYLYFVASLPALGLVRYHLWPGTEQRTLSSIQSINTLPVKSSVFPCRPHTGADFSLSSGQLHASFSGSTGLLQSVRRGGVEVGVRVGVVSYGVRGGRERSGAYLFLPDREAQPVVFPGDKLPVSIVTGPLVQEVRMIHRLVVVRQQLFNSGGDESHSVAITTTTDIRKEKNKEVALRLSSSIPNQNGVFYSDLNGMQLVRRKTVSKLPLQGNFYPMPTMALLQNETHRLSLLSAQPLGVASLRQGWLEVMLDRKLEQDDERGLGQGVKDNKVTTANFLVLLETRSSPAEAAPPLVYPSLLSLTSLDSLLHSPHISFTPSSSKFLPHTVPSPLSLLSSPLPCELHLLNLRSLPPRGAPQAALLLHHRAYDCHFLPRPPHCQPSDGTVKLQGLFSEVRVAMAMEMFLSLLEEKEVVAGGNLAVQVDPMEIEAYQLSWKL